MSVPQQGPVSPSPDASSSLFAGLGAPRTTEEEIQHLLTKHRGTGAVTKEFERFVSERSREFALSTLRQLDQAWTAGQTAKATYLAVPAPQPLRLVDGESIPAIAAQYGVTATELPGLVQKLAQELIRFPITDDTIELTPILPTLHLLRQLAHLAGQEPDPQAWISCFSTPESFLRKYLPSISQSEFSNLGLIFETFFLKELPRSCVLTDGLTTSIEERRVAGINDTWCLVPESEQAERMVVPSAAVVEAIIATEAETPHVHSFIHFASGYLLSYVAPYRCFLTPEVLLGALAQSIDVTPSLLERITPLRVSQPFRGLTGPDKDRIVPRAEPVWFSEYSMAFGFQNSESSEPVGDPGSDEQEIHTSLAIVLYPLQFCAAATEWRDHVIPDLRLLSFEAAALLARCGENIRRLRNSPLAQRLIASRTPEDARLFLADVQADLTEQSVLAKIRATNT